MNPLLQFFLQSLVSAGGFLILMIVTLIRQLCVEGGWCDIEAKLIWFGHVFILRI